MSTFTRSSIFVVAMLVSAASFAHHSFAPYDGENLVALTGRIESFRWINPHPILVLETADREDPWIIEIGSKIWDTQTNIPHDVFVENTDVTIYGWAAHDGTAKMLLSGFEIDGVRQVAMREMRIKPE